MQPPTATPEASEAAETAGSEEPTDTRSPDVPDHNTDTYDKEVAAWVIEALKRRAGEANGRERPALHAVALDAVPKSPLLEGQS